MSKKIKDIIGKMTLEEKASLCSGKNFWETKSIERLGIPSIMMTDGPHGLRKQEANPDHLGLGGSVPATAFPTASAVACSFDRDLLREMGEALGEECVKENVAILLGPGCNIKRSPLCGRNFEYFSEDPYLSSQMAKHHILGVQSKGVGTSIKHFAANNQENRRMSVDAVVDERTLREIYLASFEAAVKEAKPWTVMCSYNKLNGDYASENPYLLTKILRDEWGYEGFVVSDWGAVNERVAALAAGLELEMPHTGDFNDKLIAEAVTNGSLKEEVLDMACERLLNIILQAYEKLAENKAHLSCDLEKHNELAIKIEAESMVLLKNDNALPLKVNEKVAFIGEFFEKPRFQGGGSSHINPYKVTTGKDASEGIGNTAYAKGFYISSEDADKALTDEAIALAGSCDACVIFAGLPDRYESEGFDREHMKLPKNQEILINEIIKVCKKTIVVLHNGSAVEMPWADKASAIIEAYLGGQSVDAAVLDILYGKRNPCGKLAETFPVCAEHNPSELYFNKGGDSAEYREGIFIGYRYYDTKKLPVLYPFGHGLSYTSFEYSGLELDKARMNENEELVVRLKLKNTGEMKGKEIVQLYVKPPVTETARPVMELKGFTKPELEPGETKELEFKLDKRAFSYYNTQISDWFVENGEYEICIGKSSRDIVLSAKVYVEGLNILPINLNENTPLIDFMKLPEAAGIIKNIMSSMPFAMQSDENGMNESMGEGFANMIKYMPLRAISMMSGGAVTKNDLKNMISSINAAVKR